MKGFTLIELLTVVVIVGILASIALPQYQRAVEKSRAAEAVTIGKIIIDSQNRFLDAFPNEAPDTRGSLDIILTGGTWESADRNAQYYSTDLFTYSLNGGGVTAKRINGPFDYTIRFYNNSSSLQNVCSGDDFCAVMKDMGFGQASN